jgi:hypothetical protein
MNGKKRVIALSALLAAAAQLSGCASIVNGTNQPVSVETHTSAGKQLAGASCKLSNNKGTWFVTTPGSTTVHRSFEDLSVLCEKDNVPSGMAMVKSSTKPMAFGNIIFGGVIGAGIDVGTGAAYDYPSLIQVRMGAAPSTAAAVSAAGGRPD